MRSRNSRANTPMWQESFRMPCANTVRMCEWGRFRRITNPTMRRGRLEKRREKRQSIPTAIGRERTNILRFAKQFLSRLRDSCFTQEGRVMTPEEMRTLYDYNAWANDRQMRAASKLTADQFIKPLGSSFGSVRDTLAHIYGAEWLWLERFQGRSPSSLPDAAKFGVYKNPLWQSMQHLVNHGTYHRGQVTTLLRQNGAEPILTDLMHFYRERSLAADA